MTAAVFVLGAGLLLPATGATAVEAPDRTTRVMAWDPLPIPDDHNGKGIVARVKEAVRSCAFGGYRDRFDAVTGMGFTNTGACVAHAVRGGTQATLKLTGTVYVCADKVGEYCWGEITGSGLEPGSSVLTLAPDRTWPAPGTADEFGTLDTSAQIPCTYTVNALFVAQAVAPGNVEISSRPVISPCPVDD